MDYGKRDSKVNAFLLKESKKKKERKVINYYGWMMDRRTFSRFRFTLSVKESGVQKTNLVHSCTVMGKVKSSLATTSKRKTRVPLTSSS